MHKGRLYLSVEYLRERRRQGRSMKWYLVTVGDSSGSRHKIIASPDGDLLHFSVLNCLQWGTVGRERRFDTIIPKFETLEYHKPMVTNRLKCIRSIQTNKSVVIDFHCLTFTKWEYTEWKKTARPDLENVSIYHNAKKCRSVGLLKHYFSVTVFWRWKKTLKGSSSIFHADIAGGRLLEPYFLPQRLTIAV
jgi:hypothetical protein